MIFQYYGIDWIANILFVLFIWFQPKKPYFAQILAIFGSIGLFIMAIMINSLANMISSILFTILYIRAALILRNK